MENTIQDENVAEADTSELLGPPTPTTVEQRISICNIVNFILCLKFVCYVIYVNLKDGLTLFSFHPILMVVGWLLLMTTAINIIVPGASITHSTRHWILQACGLMFIVAGFIVILINKIIYNKVHFGTIHSWLGLTALILIVVISCSGVFTLYSGRFYTTISPVYLRIFHGVSGLITYAVGLVAIAFGFYSQWNNIPEAFCVLDTLVLITIFLLTLLRPRKLYIRISERQRIVPILP